MLIVLRQSSCRREPQMLKINTDLPSSHLKLWISTAPWRGLVLEREVSHLPLWLWNFSCRNSSMVNNCIIHATAGHTSWYNKYLFSVFVRDLVRKICWKDHDEMATFPFHEGGELAVGGFPQRPGVCCARGCTNCTVTLAAEAPALQIHLFA